MVNMVNTGRLCDSYNDVPLDAEMFSQHQLESENKTSHIRKQFRTLQSKQNYVCRFSVLKSFCQQDF